MYSTNNGDVNLNVGLDTGSAKKDALQLAKSIVDTFKGADKSIQSQSSSMQSLENRIAKTSDKLADLRNKQTELSKQQIPTEQYTTLSNTIAKLEGQLEKLGNKSIQLQNGAQTNRTKKQLDDIEKEAERLQSQLTYSEEALQNLVNSGKAFTLGTDTEAYSKISQQIGYTESEMEVLNLKHDEMIAKQNKVVSGADRIRNAFTSVRDTVSKLVTGVKRFATAGKKSFDNINKSTKRGIFTLLKYTLGIRSLFILFRRLRSAATEALKAMGQKFPEVQKDLNNLKSAFTGFKASIGTAFQPLLAAATPVLLTIINLATKAANAIGSLFAALTGQDYVYKATTANNDYADSVSGVGKAAKEANKQLGEYDELMVIQSDNDSGGSSGGGGGAAGSGMNWEKVPVEKSIQDLADKIKTAWRESKFFELGEEVGKKIKKKLESIPWEKIQSTAKKVGEDLADFLNGFIQSGIAGTTGETIAEALNTAIGMVTSFGHKFEWEKNGKAIGKMFNKLVEHFDEEQFADMITTFIKGALDLATAFLTEADFNELGVKVGNFLNDLLVEVPEITVKIAKLAWEIAEDAAGFVAGVNEASPLLVDIMMMLGFTKLIALGFVSPAVAITVVVGKVSWDIGNAIYESLEKDEKGNNIIDRFVESSGLGDLAVDIADIFDFETDAETSGGDMITGFMTGVLNSLMALDDWLGEKVNEYIIEPWKELLGISDKGASGGGGGGPKKDGESFIQKFKDGITDAVSNIKEWFKTNVTDKITEAWDNIKELSVSISAKFLDTKEAIQAKWDEIVSGVNDKVADMKARVATTWDDIKDAWESIVNNVKDKVADMKAKVATTWDDIKGQWESIYNNFKGKEAELKFKFKQVWDNFKDKVAGVRDNFKGKVASLKFSFTEKWENFKKKYSKFIGHFKDKTFEIKARFSAAAQDLKNWINTNVFSKINSKLIGANVPLLSNYIKNHPLKLAKGAVIPPNKEFMAILGDQKQGVNIETPLSTMVEAFNKALDMRGSSDSNREPIVLQLDGRTVAKVVWNEEEKRYKQTGRYNPSYGY